MKLFNDKNANSYFYLNIVLAISFHPLANFHHPSAISYQPSSNIHLPSANIYRLIIFSLFIFLSDLELHFCLQLIDLSRSIKLKYFIKLTNLENYFIEDISSLSDKNKLNI